MRPRPRDDPAASAQVRSSVAHSFRVSASSSPELSALLAQLPPRTKSLIIVSMLEEALAHENAAELITRRLAPDHGAQLRALLSARPSSGLARRRATPATTTSTHGGAETPAQAKPSGSPPLDRTAPRSSGPPPPASQPDAAAPASAAHGTQEPQALPRAEPAQSAALSLLNSFQTG